jgi:RNA polymerase sigma-70 factor (ECF subfamily)
MHDRTILGEHPTEDDLLAAARDGDEGAFAALVAPRRAELLAHCYRMLGSAHEADDVLQDALVRIWRGLRGFEGRSSLRVWMFRVTTNACIDARHRRTRRALPVALGPAADPEGPLDQEPAEVAWLEPFLDPVGAAEDATGPEARYERLESVELAFVAALQHLPPNERTVLLLREVLRFSAREVADALGTSTAAVNSALQRARARVDGQLPRPSQQEVRKALGEEGVRALVEGYVRAMARGDADAVVALLAEDASWSMPPLARWYQGRPAIARWLRREPLRLQWRHLPTHANGQPAVACYAWRPDRGLYVAEALDVLTLQGGQIAAITAFLDVRHILRAGLPPTLPPGTETGSPAGMDHTELSPRAGA